MNLYWGSTSRTINSPRSSDDRTPSTLYGVITWRFDGQDTMDPVVPGAPLCRWLRRSRLRRSGRRTVPRWPGPPRHDRGGQLGPFGQVGASVVERDHPVAAVLGQVQRAAPGVEGSQPVAPTYEVGHVHEPPHQVCGQAGQLAAEGVGDSVLVADGGH